MTATSFADIGKVIASLGSRHFARTFHALVEAHLAAPVDRLDWQPIAPPSARDPLTERADARSCETRAGRTLNLRAQSDAARHLTVQRLAPGQVFSEQERERLHAIAPLLFSLLGQHQRLALPLAEANRPAQSLESRFHQRLQQSGLSLSERETQVCLGLLAGRTAAQQAEALQLTVNTVDSYQRRAAVKLNIRGRHSLMRWLYADAEGEHVEQAPSPRLLATGQPVPVACWLDLPARYGRHVELPAPASTWKPAGGFR
ncbi:LuxR C-terminal-related transcriptional regulator [Pseudomonas monteilii]